MADTREKILLTALRLFAVDGYEGVSVSEIAGELGLTKGALYRHYPGKRAIFQAILSRMEQRDAEQAQENALPSGTAEEMPERYQNASLTQTVEFARAMFRYWTEDPFASQFRRMLTLEQYRSAEMGRLYQQYLAAGPLGYMADLLRGMGISDPERRAAEFYGPMFLLYSVYDGGEDKAAVTALLDACLDSARGQLEVCQTSRDESALELKPNRDKFEK